ncbi:MAG: DNA translocase FtsK 4TM domain-containing protein [Thermodesulfobacteriota bacterium]|nr:DNA translocase FtsK 4TM domain-containing protein [Thermodesulfobacteriota bacterium]
MDLKKDRETRPVNKYKTSKTASLSLKNRISREIVGLVIFGIALFITSSLISYDPKDPSFNSYVSHTEKVNNLWGITGAYLADAVLQIFGLASYLFSIILFVLSMRLFFIKEFRFNYCKLIAYILLILATTGILSLRFNNLTVFDQPVISGGVLGGVLVSELERYFNRMGAYTLLLLIFVSSLMVSVNISLWWVGKRAKELFLIVLRNLHLYYLKNKQRFKPLKEKPSNKKKNKGSYTSEPPAIIDSPPKTERAKECGEPKQREFDIPKAKGTYQCPPVSLLDTQEQKETTIDRESLVMNAKVLEKKLYDFGVEGKVTEIRPGPVITMYEFEPAPGIKINRIVNLSDDLALALRAISVRIVAPIPGKSVVGIEIPNTIRETVFFNDIVDKDVFYKTRSRLTVVLGKDIFGNPIVSDLAKMPHLLIAGATGTGKSISVNSMICSILFKAAPDEVKMIMIDPKRLELSVYDGIPHLLCEVVTEAKQAAIVLKWLVEEMERRYRLLAEKGVRNIERYNQKIDSESIDPARVILDIEKDTSADDGAESCVSQERLPYVAVIIDELADLMMVSSKEVEESIARLAQMARAAGIHLIVATQRPSVDVLTGIIKVNFPARISFQVSSKVDSRTILDTNGAEHLLGSGDMLFLLPGTAKIQRIHGAYLSEKEIKGVVDFIKEQVGPSYNPSIFELKQEAATKDSLEYDEKYDKAVELVANTKQASISMVQRHLRIGYNRAARIIEKMEEEGVVGPSDGVKPRKVLINRL